MNSRRAVSPVIATVILIAVAVALGIAVAVWAGALTGGLQKQEKLIINSYVTGTTLVITITNQSPGQITITQVLFNQAPIKQANWVPDGAKIVATATAATEASGLSGTLSPTAASITADTGTTPTSGVTYPITVVTAAGNSYPATITWP
jgi:flagellin-like protein